MKLTIEQLNHAEKRLTSPENNAPTGFDTAKAALFRDAAAFASFAQRKNLNLSFSADTFGEFQEAVIQFYVFLCRNTTSTEQNRSILLEKIGAYLTVMVCNDLQEVGAQLLLPPVTTDGHLLVSVMPGMILNLYDMAADAAAHEFQFDEKYVSVRFHHMMDTLSACMDKVEATPDSALNPVTPLL